MRHAWIKRLMSIKTEQDGAGQQIREFRGEGDRQYLTGLKLGGERTLILVDRSASMLSDTLVNVIRRRNLPVAEQLKSRKWRQFIATVNWITTQLDEDDQYQIYMFNNTAEPVIRGTEGVWLTADDGVHLALTPGCQIVYMDGYMVALTPGLSSTGVFFYAQL